MRRRRSRHRLTASRRGKPDAQEAAANSPCMTRAQFSSHPSVSDARYFAVVLSACGVPTISASIISARSRKFGGVP